MIGTNPSGHRDCGKCPVETVSWDDTQVFLKKLNAMDKVYKYRLPSESEWEYAARAGTTTPTYFGTSINGSDANFDKRYPYNGGTKAQYLFKSEIVGQYKPNAFGKHCMTCTATFTNGLRIRFTFAQRGGLFRISWTSVPKAQISIGSAKNGTYGKGDIWAGKQRQEGASLNDKSEVVVGIPTDNHPDNTRWLNQ